MEIASPKSKDVVDLRGLREQPPLVISSPKNNDGPAKNRLFEGYDHHSKLPMEVVAKSRPTPSARDNNTEGMTATNAVHANDSANVNSWVSMTGAPPPISAG